jgi:hypothetical protein
MTYTVCPYRLTLFSLEAAAVILLLGAQVIAEYERIGISRNPSHGLQTWTKHGCRAWHILDIRQGFWS